MKVLLDHNMPPQLRRHLTGHLVMTAVGMGWNELENGVLLATAEAAGFVAMITGDQNISYQQNNAKRIIALVVLTQTNKRVVLAHHAEIASALRRVLPGSFELVQLPNERNKRTGIRPLE